MGWIIVVVIMAAMLMMIIANLSKEHEACRPTERDCEFCGKGTNLTIKKTPVCVRCYHIHQRLERGGIFESFLRGGSNNTRCKK